MNLFGKAKVKPSSPKDAIIKLREMITVLEKKEKYLQLKVDQELAIARENATKNKRAALMALKRKRQYENEIGKINGTMTTLETQVMTIENANVNLEALNAMKAGSDAMKSIHGSINIDKVDDTMDDIREQMDLANEVSSAISQPVGFGIEFDEDELNNELEALEQEEMDNKLLNANNIPVKTVPVKTVPVKKPSLATPAKTNARPPPELEEDPDDELEELRSSMAL